MFFSVELLQKKQFRQKGPGFGNCQAFLGVPRQIFFFFLSSSSVNIFRSVYFLTFSVIFWFVPMIVSIDVDVIL